MSGLIGWDFAIATFAADLYAGPGAATQQALEVGPARRRRLLRGSVACVTDGPLHV